MRAFTLIEVMVALFLSGLLLTILVRLFSVSSRTSREELSRSSAETAVLLMLRSLESDLQNTTPAGVSLASDGLKLATHPMDEALSTGGILYQDLMVAWIYDSANRVLRRVEYEGVVTELRRPRRLTEVELAALGAGKLSRVLEGVTSFLVENPPDVTAPQIGTPLTVTIQKEIESAENRPTVTLMKSIQVRTGGN